MKIVTTFSPHRIGRQQYCLETWKKYGHPIVALQNESEMEFATANFSGVEFKLSASKKIPTVDEVLLEAKDETILFINSDISIKSSKAKFINDWIRPPQKGLLKVGLRHERIDKNRKYLTPNGVDIFRITPAIYHHFLGSPFTIGQAGWDYWMVLQADRRKLKIKYVDTPDIIHEFHPVDWNKEQHSEAIKWLSGVKKFGRGHIMSKKVRKLTGRYGKAAPDVRFLPTKMQVQCRQAGTICLVAQPRTGSNLLLTSLGNHPGALNRGEFNVPYEFQIPSAQDYLKQTSIPDLECNLAKVFSGYIQEPDILNFISNSDLVIGLYRKDKDAQLASWQRACKTGIWREEQQGKTPPRELPTNPKQWLESNLADLRKVCNFIISYEDLIANWDDILQDILDLAGWPYVGLPKATKKITNNPVR